MEFFIKLLYEVCVNEINLSPYLLAEENKKSFSLNRSISFWEPSIEYPSNPIKKISFALYSIAVWIAIEQWEEMGLSRYSSDNISKVFSSQFSGRNVPISLGLGGNINFGIFLLFNLSLSFSFPTKQTI